MSLVYEQIVLLKNSTLIFLSSLDRVRVRDEAFSTNLFNLRTDWLLPKFREYTPSLGLGLTLTDPINDRQDRGLEKMINPNTRVSRRFGKNWGGNFRLEHQRNYSKDEASFAFKKTIYAFELEYLF
ncbi:MAG TPA: hypothetical protein VNJ08_12430 [Bacteriovoracaceae bacterium]|nr:hypothetical protein [Bacteriovoracaceae bacterium]